MRWILIFCAVVFLFVGCGQSVKYVCSDGSVVRDVSQCPPFQESSSQSTIPSSESPPTDIFDLKKGESINFEGKKVKLVDVFSDGKTSIDVSGITREIKSTKHLEIINGLEIVVQSINYIVTNPQDSTATLKINTLILNNGEYLFFVDYPQLVDGVEVTLRGVTSSYIIVDAEDVTGMKIYPGSSKVISGLNVTNVRAFARGIRAEDYAILRIVKV